MDQWEHSQATAICNVTTHSEQMCASIALWSRCLPFK